MKGHSKKCSELENIKFENLRDINIEIYNYDNYINSIKEILKVYLFLTYANFITESNKDWKSYLNTYIPFIGVYGI